MALQRIGPTTPTRDVVVDDVSYRKVFRRIQLRASVPQYDTGTFATEQAGPQLSPGITMLTLTLGGLMSKGDASAVPLFPPPQDVPVSVVYAGSVAMDVVTGTCKVDITSMNFEDSSLDIDYGGMGQTPDTARSNGSFAVTWDAGT